MFTSLEGFIETLTTFQKPYTLGGNLKKNKNDLSIQNITCKGSNYLNYPETHFVSNNFVKPPL